MQKIVTFLWFDNQAQEAAEYYTSLFPKSKIISSTPMVTTFLLDGQEYMALNGGPQFKFTEAISLFVKCTTQNELDHYWNHLSAGGSTSQCGWLKDKYGLSWQVVPTVLGELMADSDVAKSKRVLDAMLKMTKIDIAKLQEAAIG